MKKIITIMLCLFTMGVAYSQSSSAHIKFMGVEVNGQVSTVEQRLTTKGFSKTKDDMYKGKFSGYEVKLKLQKTVKSKTVYGIVVLFGEDATHEDLVELANSLNEKYGTENAFTNNEDGLVGIELPEGSIVLNFNEKTLSYLDKANMQKNKKESKEDL
ncbi:MAG: hypothetical protein MJZ57_09170, partial [Bacteroidales bacterium]|nr:hypothetical protein [Bacteroidales bacterium]